MSIRRATVPLLVCAALAAGVMVASAPRALAAGDEDTVGGSIALGRAANYVRVNDFMATWQNPANLAVVPGTDLGGELRLPRLSGCFDRARDPSVAYRQPDPATGFQGSESFDAVCNHALPMPAGNLGWAQSFESGIGYGIGVFTPAGVGATAYGTDTVVTVYPLPNEQRPITASGTESPTRHMLVARRVMAAWLMAGVGVEPLSMLRFGLSAGLGFASISNKTVSSVAGGSFRDQEVLNTVTVVDWAVPRVVGSLVFSPLDAFDLMGTLTYQGDVKAKGHVELQANGIQGAAVGDCRVPDPATPGPRCRADGVTLQVPLPTLEATVGLRYASRRVARERVLDPIRDEAWDVELDGFWAQTSHVDEYRLQISPPTQPDAARIMFTSDPMGIPLYAPRSAAIPRHWRDTFGARLGGDYNVIASRLSVRAGLSYQSSAVPTQYMNLDAWPVQKIGLHAGLTVGLGRVKLSAAYAHLIFRTVDVPLGTGDVTEVVSQMPEAAQAVNEGHYTAGLDVFSLQANVTF